jgi:hypothetical protein
VVTRHEVVIEFVQQFGSTGVRADLHKLNPELIVLDAVTVKTVRRINDNSLEFRLVGYTRSCEP